MKKWVVVALILALGYGGIAYLMETLTFEGLPGQMARASAFTIWNGVAGADPRTGAVHLTMDEINAAIDFNPKIRLVAFQGTAEPISEAQGDEILKKSRNAYRQDWPQAVKKNETLAHFRATVDFTVESTCIPFIRRQRSFQLEVVTSCPLQRR